MHFQVKMPKNCRENLFTEKNTTTNKVQVTYLNVTVLTER